MSTADKVFVQPKSENMQTAYFGNFWPFLEDFWPVYREHRQPQHCTLYYCRYHLNQIWSYPNRKAWKSISYRFIHYFLLINQCIMLLTLIFGIQESTSFVDIGDDSVWIIGIALIASKNWYTHFRADNIDELIDGFERFNHFYGQVRDDPDIHDLQRTFFMAGFGIQCNVGVLCFLLNLAICSQPLWTHQFLPFHSVYPFEWHNSQKNPLSHLLLYIMQCIMSVYNLSIILEIDLLGVTAFAQTALNLKILCIELRKLSKPHENDEIFRKKLYDVVQFHQQIIRIVEKTNKVFYGSFIIQLVASFLMVSLSAFEAIAAKDDLKIAAKFEVFMITVFIQLSLWCVAGDMVFNQSLKVAQAAFEITDWHTKSAGIQRDIMFIIQRSQTPLVYVAKPFLPFTLATYTAILKQCYTILALLRESID